MQKSFKRTLSLLLCVLMVTALFTAMPLTVSAAQGDIQLYFYNSYDDAITHDKEKTYNIIKYTKDQILKSGDDGFDKTTTDSVYNVQISSHDGVLPENTENLKGFTITGDSDVFYSYDRDDNVLSANEHTFEIIKTKKSAQVFYLYPVYEGQGEVTVTKYTKTISFNGASDQNQLTYTFDPTDDNAVTTAYNYFHDSSKLSKMYIPVPTAPEGQVFTGWYDGDNEYFRYSDNPNAPFSFGSYFNDNGAAFKEWLKNQNNDTKNLTAHYVDKEQLKRNIVIGDTTVATYTYAQTTEGYAAATDHFKNIGNYSGVTAATPLATQKFTGYKDGSFMVLNYSNDAFTVSGDYFDDQVTQSWLKNENLTEASLTLTAAFDTTVPEIIGYSATLSDVIRLNFYVKPNGYTQEQLTVTAENTHYTTHVDDPSERSVEVKENSTEGYFVYSVKVYAKEMADEFTLNVAYNNGQSGGSITDGKSVKAYMEQLMTLGKNELTALCVATLNYGAAAQIQFDYHTDNLANAIAVEGIDTSVPEITDTLAYDEGSQAAYSGMEYYASSLGLFADTSYALCFEQTGTLPEVTYNGSTLSPVTVGTATMSDGSTHNMVAYYIEGIAAKNLLNDIKVNIGGTDYTFNVKTYIKKVLATEGQSPDYDSNKNNDSIGNQTLANLTNTVKAIYNYSKCAAAYFA